MSSRKVSPSDPAVKAYRQVQTDLERTPSSPTTPASGGASFGNYRTATSDHFVVVHNASGSSTPPEVAAF